MPDPEGTSARASARGLELCDTGDPLGAIGLVEDASSGSGSSPMEVR